MPHRRLSLRRCLLSAAVFGIALLYCVPRVQATIAEQRARLPPAATCEDPVEGIWLSHKYNPRHNDWTVFTLEIHRVPGNDRELRGVIRNHSWIGGPQQQEPGPCQSTWHWIVSMDGRGHSDGTNISFGGVGRWRLDQMLCIRGPYGYNLDNFSGRIDPERQEFQSVNNDGGRSVNDPHVFRRIRCFEPDSQPHIQIAPPPFFPERDQGC